MPITVDGDVVGSLGISGPSHRLDGDRLETELPELLLVSANEFELNITYELDDRADNLVE